MKQYIRCRDCHRLLAVVVGPARGGLQLKCPRCKFLDTYDLARTIGIGGPEGREPRNARVGGQEVRNGQRGDVHHDDCHASDGR